MPPLRLEVFRPDPALLSDLAQGATQEPAEIEEARLEAFEAGYKAGWDDATTAREDEAEALRREIGKSLQALSFTYQEARAHVLAALSPLIADVSARLLPEIARASLPALISEALAAYADLASEAPVKLHVHPSARAMVLAHLGADPGLPVTVIDNGSLTPGQATIALGDVETLIDIDAALDSIRKALTDFFDHAHRETNHG